MRTVFTQPFTSYSHRLARILVRPMVGRRITPNHLTTLRLLTGLGACGGFAVGGSTWDLWSGILWILSCFLDQADGELARLGGTVSESGHRYDYICDVAVNGLLFLAIGIGMRDGELGGWAVAMGALAGASVAAASVLSERLEQFQGTGAKAYSGIFGFDFDEALYLIGPAAWLGWFPYLLIGAAVCAPLIAAVTWWRLAAGRVRDG